MCKHQPDHDHFLLATECMYLKALYAGLIGRLRLLQTKEACTTSEHNGEDSSSELAKGQFLDPAI